MARGRIVIRFDVVHLRLFQPSASASTRATWRRECFGQFVLVPKIGARGSAPLHAAQGTSRMVKGTHERVAKLGDQPSSRT